MRGTLADVRDERRKVPESPPRRKVEWFVPVAGVGMPLMLVIGLFASAVAWNFAGQGPRARIAVTQSTRASLDQMVVSFEAANGTYPPTLNLLVPTYTTTIPLDGWQRPFIFKLTPNGPKPFDLRSVGPDGIPGNADDIW